MISNENSYKFYRIRCKEEKEREELKCEAWKAAHEEVEILTEKCEDSKDNNIEFDVYTMANLIVKNGNEVRILDETDKENWLYYCNPFYYIEFYLPNSKNGISRSMCLFKLVNEKIILDEKGTYKNSFILIEEDPLETWEDYIPPKIISKLVFAWALELDSCERIYLLTTNDGMVKILDTSFIEKEGETFNITSRYWNNLIEYKIVFDKIPFLMNDEFFMQNKQDKKQIVKLENNKEDNKENNKEDNKEDINSQDSKDPNNIYVVKEEPCVYKVNLQYSESIISFKVIFEEAPDAFDVISTSKGYLFVHNDLDLSEFWIENEELLQNEVNIGYMGYYWLDFEGTFEFPFIVNGFRVNWKGRNNCECFSLDSNVEDLLEYFLKSKEPIIIQKPEELARSCDIKYEYNEKKEVSVLSKSLHSHYIEYSAKYLGELLIKKNEIRLKKGKDNKHDNIFYNNIIYTVVFSNKKRSFLEKPLEVKFIAVDGNLIILTQGIKSNICSMGEIILRNFNNQEKAKIMLS